MMAFDSRCGQYTVEKMTEDGMEEGQHGAWDAPKPDSPDIGGCTGFDGGSEAQ